MNVNRYKEPPAPPLTHTHTHTYIIPRQSTRFIHGTILFYYINICEFVCFWSLNIIFANMMTFHYISVAYQRVLLIKIAHVSYILYQTYNNVVNAFYLKSFSCFLWISFESFKSLLRVPKHTTASIALLLTSHRNSFTAG